jgi:hypothetical protein
MLTRVELMGRVASGGITDVETHPKSSEVPAGSQRGHSACLAARVSGGLKSRSARGHGPISKGGGNASLAEVGGRYGEAYTGTKAKAGDSQGGPEATTKRASEGRAPTVRWGLKGLRRTTGS